MLPPYGFTSKAYKYTLHFHCASEFYTLRLACMLDSLVRVSRRVNKNRMWSEYIGIKKNTNTHTDERSTPTPMQTDTTRCAEAQARSNNSYPLNASGFKYF
jgi:hypothetical protein